MLHDEYGEKFAKLKEILAVCPPLEEGNFRCQACPHLTYLEFLSLFDNLQKNLVLADLQAVIATPPQLISGTPHLACPLLHKGICLANGGQGVFCYLGEDLSRCLQMTPERVEQIFTDLNAIAAPLHENLTEPYYLNILNIPCWFAVMLDQTITQPLFVSLRQQMEQYFDVPALLPYYKNHTQLNEKLNLIDRFFQLNAEQRAEEALACIRKIQTAFPFTGAYYAPQADTYIQFMEELLKALKIEPR